MVDPEDLARRARHNANILIASRSHEEDRMTIPVSIAGFEIAEIFAEWARRMEAGEADDIGVTYRVSTETTEEYGQRIAAGLLKLLKEV